MKGCRRLAIGCGATLLVFLAGCGVALLALAPGRGPEVREALPEGADLLVNVRDLEGLLNELDRTGHLARIREALGGTETGREVLEALEGMPASGVPLARTALSSVLSREAGAAVSFDPGGRVSEWVFALKIGLLLRLVELGVRASLPVEKADLGGSPAYTLQDAGASASWLRLGDLLLVSDGLPALEGALRETEREERPESPLRPRTTSDSTSAREEATHVFLRAREPLRLARDAAGLDVTGVSSLLRELGLPSPLASARISFELLEDGRISEETFLEGPVPVPDTGERPPGKEPENCFAFLTFRPGLRRAASRLLALIGSPAPGSPAAWRLFKDELLRRIGPRVSIAVASQETSAEGGGFPAEFTFFSLQNAEALAAGLEGLLGGWGLGLFEDSSRPAGYPYVVRHRTERGRIYEFATARVRRREGFSPALGVRGDELVFSTSLGALKRYMGRGREKESPAPGLRPGELLKFSWRTPPDLRPLKNAYDYFVESVRFGPGRTEEKLSDETDYEAVWEVISGVLKVVRRHERTGFGEPTGLRMEAVWELADE